MVFHLPHPVKAKLRRQSADWRALTGRVRRNAGLSRGNPSFLLQKAAISQQIGACRKRSIIRLDLRRISASGHLPLGGRPKINRGERKPLCGLRSPWRQKSARGRGSQGRAKPVHFTLDFLFLWCYGGVRGEAPNKRHLLSKCHACGDLGAIGVKVVPFDCDI